MERQRSLRRALLSRRLLAALLAVSSLAFAGRARADIINFDAVLTGGQEVPPTGSPATGFGTLVLDTVAQTITVNESWQNLSAGATASHIHGPAAPGTNAPVLFPLDLGSGAGATTGSIPEQVFAITPAQILDLKAGLFYLNVHTTTFPGGEIRGQIMAVPEPSTVTLGLLLGATVWAGRGVARRLGRRPV